MYDRRWNIFKFKEFIVIMNDEWWMMLGSLHLEYPSSCSSSSLATCWTRSHTSGWSVSASSGSPPSSPWPYWSWPTCHGGHPPLKTLTDLATAVAAVSPNGKENDGALEVGEELEEVGALPLLQPEHQEEGVQLSAILGAAIARSEINDLLWPPWLYPA